MYGQNSSINPSGNDVQGEDTVNAQKSTLFVRDVGKIDSALFDPSLGIVGNSWYVDVSLATGRYIDRMSPHCQGCR
ncbi:MAG: hypothetical protein WCL28_10790, partial [bacterium]